MTTDLGARGAGAFAGSPELFGRDAERRQLTQALAEAASGRGSLIALSGEPGLGKTRLALELEREAKTSGFLVAWGKSWQAGGAPAFWPWSEALTSLVGRLPGAAQDSLFDSALAGLAPLLPERTAHLMRPDESDAASARFALFRAVRTLLERAASSAPLLLIFEDLHAADSSSVLLLTFLSQQVRELPLLLLVTFRELETRLAPELGPAIAKLVRAGHELALTRLDAASAFDFVRAAAPSLEPAQQQRVLAVAAGNPLFLGELVRLCRSDPRGFASGRWTVPRGVHALIEERLQLLPAGAVAALGAAAALGDEFDLRLLASVSGTAPESLEPALESAFAAGVLAERDSQRAGFVHALYREALQRRLRPSERQRLHAAALRELATRHERDPRPPLTELAHHALEAGEDFVAAAVAYSIQAAEAALTMLAHEDAISLLERARQVVEAGEAPGKPRAEVLLSLGLTEIRSGRMAEGRDKCLHAAELARALGDAELFARAALGYGAEITIGVVDDALIALLNEALSSLPEANSRLRVTVMARLSAAQLPCKNAEGPIERARQAIELARRLDHEPTLLGVMHFAMAALMDYVDARERLPLNREMGQLAARLHDRQKQLRASLRLVFDFLELGDFHGVELQTAECERLSSELGLPQHRYRAPLFRAMCALAAGRFAAAANELTQAEASAPPAAEASRCLAGHRAGALRAQERLRELVSASSEAWSTFGGLSEAGTLISGSRALWYSRLEDEAATRRHLEEISRDSWVWEGDPPALMLVAEPVALVGTAEQARELYARLLPRSGLDISWGLFACLWDGPADRLLGLLAERAGELDCAERHFVAAIARLERLEAPPYLARTRYEFSRMLERRAIGDDLARAAELRRGAAEVARELGLSALSELIAQKRPEPGLGPDPETPAFTLRREGQFWTLSWQGGVAHLKDSRGQRMLARLLAATGQAIHARDLASVSPESGAATGIAADAGDAGDAGEMLDDRARDEYRRRIDGLRAELDEAEGFNDAARAERLRAELEFLSDELARAIGLGGRARRAASGDERARVAVQRRLRDAISRIEAAAPAIGRHLSQTVDTGLFCAYRPGRPAGATKARGTRW